MNRDEKSLYFRSFFSVFPACAGVILRYALERISQSGVPRMCGGDPKKLDNGRTGDRCSPHVRG